MRRARGPGSLLSRGTCHLPHQLRLNHDRSARSQANAGSMNNTSRGKLRPRPVPSVITRGAPSASVASASVRAVTNRRHGTSVGWHSGCRCTLCRRAHSDTQRAFGRARAQSRLPVVTRQQLLRLSMPASHSGRCTATSAGRLSKSGDLARPTTSGRSSWTPHQWQPVGTTSSTVRMPHTCVAVFAGVSRASTNPHGQEPLSSSLSSEFALSTNSGALTTGIVSRLFVGLLRDNPVAGRRRLPYRSRGVGR